MQKILFILISLCLFNSCKVATTYQTECYSVSEDASYIVDITLEGQSILKDTRKIKADAIDGILFRGITGKNCVTQKPLIQQTKSEVKNNKFINSIYKNSGGSDKYITKIEQLKTKQILGLSKQLYQHKYRLTINKDLLRKDLISAGLIKDLNSIF